MNKDCKIYNGQWYQDSEIYDKFAIAEDREDKGLNPIKEFLGAGFVAENPIDLGSGTGRAIDWIIKNIPYKGMIYAVEKSQEMCDFLEKKYDWRVVVIKATTDELLNHPLRNNIQSNFIISRFGFPSKIWDKKMAWEELVAVNSLLTETGYFFTSGWDEKFCDELNELWYRHIPDGLQAKTFEEWCKERVSAITSPRNANLTWLKQDIETELKFNSLQESAYIMGTLFGEGALKEIVEQSKTIWKMKMAISANDKKEIENILKNYERQ